MRVMSMIANRTIVIGLPVQLGLKLCLFHFGLLELVTQLGLRLLGGLCGLRMCLIVHEDSTQQRSTELKR